MRRPLLLLLIAVGVLVFLAISAVLARVLSIDGAERSALTSLVTAEARGDRAGAASQLYHCSASAACQGRVAVDTAALRHPGAVSIIQIQPSAGFSLTSTLGVARVAWQVGGSLPIVSSSGQTPATAVVWLIRRGATEQLEAYDAMKLGPPIFAANAGVWSNRQSGAAFVTPLVANGRVYVPAYKTVTVFGLTD